MADQLERWYVDGLELTDGMVREVESYEGQFIGPSLIATDVVVPGRDGEIAGSSRLSPGGFTLHVWVAGDTRAEVERNWEFILQITMKRHRLVRWMRRRPDGSARECFGRVVGRISPTPIGRLGMRAQIEVQIPSGSWQATADSDSGAIALVSNGPLIPVSWVDPNPGGRLEEDQLPPRDPTGSTTVTAYNGSDGSATYTGGWVLHPTDHLFRRTGGLPTTSLHRYVPIGNFQGSTAPMTRLWVQVVGPVNGLRVTCPETGAWSAYDLDLAADQAVTIDAARDIIGAPRVDAFRYRGPYMIEMIPPDRIGPTHPPLLQVDATLASPAATIRVRGRRLYQTM